MNDDGQDNAAEVNLCQKQWEDDGRDGKDCWEASDDEEEEEEE